MKLLLTLLAVCLVGCAGNRRSTAISYEQLQNIKYSNSDCAYIGNRITFLEAQIQARGLTNAIPEQLSEEDRVYHATARIMVWNLRIGCNDPYRYSKK